MPHGPFALRGVGRLSLATGLTNICPVRSSCKQQGTQLAEPDWVRVAVLRAGPWLSKSRLSARRFWSDHFPLPSAQPHFPLPGTLGLLPDLCSWLPQSGRVSFHREASAFFPPKLVVVPGCADAEGRTASVWSPRSLVAPWQLEISCGGSIHTPENGQRYKTELRPLCCSAAGPGCPAPSPESLLLASGSLLDEETRSTHSAPRSPGGGRGFSS